MGGLCLLLECSGRQTLDLVGVPFVLIGLYLVVGRFFVEASKRKRIFYGITTNGLLRFPRFFSRTVTSVNLRTLSDSRLLNDQTVAGISILAGQLGLRVGSKGWAIVKARRTTIIRADCGCQARLRSLRDAHTKAQYDR